MANVVVINLLEVPEGMGAEALAAWDANAEFFRTQRGYIGTKLHQSVTPGAAYPLINVAEWERAEDFQAAITSAAFERIAAANPSPATYHPGTYTVIRT